MKENAIVIGALMFLAAGCAHQGGAGRTGTDSGFESSAEPLVEMRSVGNTTENLDRNPSGAIRTPSTATQLPDSAETISARDVDAYSSSANAALKSDPNWNPSDDLLRDGTGGKATENSASAGGAARSETGGASSGDLNSSPKLERNISGDFTLGHDIPNRDGDEEKQGHINVSPPPQVGVTGNEPEPRSNNNRALGVGSAATGEFGAASSTDALTTEISRPLEQRVKASLVTGAGLSQAAARNIEVTEHDGVVTLRGSMDSQYDRESVETAILRINGVKRVVNEITVRPSTTSRPSSDGQIPE